MPVTREQIQAFHANRGAMSEDDKVQITRALVASHDEIIPADKIENLLATGDKLARRSIYTSLETESKKYPFMVAHEDPVLGGGFLSLRAKMEAFRGIKRDALGKIVRTPEWRAARIAELNGKIVEVLGPNPDLSKQWGPKIDAILQEVAYQQAFLDGKSANQGDVLDVVAKFSKVGE